MRIRHKIMKIDCIICNSEMEVSKKIRDKKFKTKITRWACTVCDYETTIFSGGDDKMSDDITESLHEVQKIYREQESNQY